MVVNIGIVYNLTREMLSSRHADQWDDWEVINIADGIRMALEFQGCHGQVVNICEEGFDGLKAFDMVFNLAENTAGCEMGVVAITRRLEEMGIAFTGAGSKALVCCEDKARMKAVLFDRGLPTPAYQVFDHTGDLHLSLDYPLIVKPLREDSSVGISFDSVVMDDKALARQVEWILNNCNQPALVEDYIDGREFSVSVIGSGDCLRSLPLVEDLFLYSPDQPRIMTFQAKWLPGSYDWEHVNCRLALDLDPELEAEIKSTAIQVCRYLDCQDYTRIDFRLRRRDLFVLDANPNPCLNQQGSSFLTAAKAAGFTFEAIIGEILESALHRHLKG